MKRTQHAEKCEKLSSSDVADGIALLLAPLLRAYCISVRQFDRALRHSAVHLEASKFASGKANKAQIAFSTSLSRSDVAKLLRQPKPLIPNEIQALIALWVSDRRFLTAADMPAVLPVWQNQEL